MSGCLCSMVGGRGEVAYVAFSPAVQLISSNRVESVCYGLWVSVAVSRIKGTSSVRQTVCADTRAMRAVYGVVLRS